MIIVDGEWWGTAAEIAEHLGQGVTVRAVRHWADRDGLPSARAEDENGRPQVRYLFGKAAQIEAAKRHSRKGRRRPA